MRGNGFTFEVPEGWQATPKGAGIVATRGRALVSVTRFPLLKAYDPAKFAAVAQELDRVAAQLAKQSGATLDSKETTTVDGRKVRAYRYGQKRIAFVLNGRREYQLFCSSAAAACDLLFDSFALT